MYSKFVYVIYLLAFKVEFYKIKYCEINVCVCLPMHEWMNEQLACTKPQDVTPGFIFLNLLNFGTLRGIL